MKKILLSFFLLTSLNLYSQVANMTHCAGDTTFNITYHYSLLIGNLNPAETTVSYHLSAADASNGVNAISNPTNFIVPQNQSNVLVSQTIFARINHLGNITTNYFSLIVNPYLMVLGSTQPIDCYNNGTIMLDVFGGQAPYTCLINGYPSFSNFLNLDSNHSILPIPNLVAGIYNIEIRDAIGCHALGSWTIEPSSIIRLDTPTATLTNVKCQGNNDGAITINATGGKLPYSYSIDDGATYVTNNTFTNLVAGKYFTYVKDANGCTDLRTQNITEPTPLQVVGAITKPFDCISNATVTLTATGGISPYTYSKDGGITFVTSNTFTNLIAGNYAVSVKDSNGCITSNNITIDPLVPLIATASNTNINCYGDNSGSITVVTTGGQTPYTYSIGNNYQTSNVFSGLPAGLYSITIGDALGCIVMTTITIQQPTTPLTATIETKSQTITIDATGGSGLIKYAISPDTNIFTTNNTFANLTTGIYTLIAQDQNGCFISLSNTINPPAPLVNGKNVMDFIFKLGQTLADIIIDLPNIKWYIKASASTTKTSKITESELPLTTVLVEGTTYYASQTINGVESTERLAVTTKLSSLGTNDFDITNFVYYPNPVKNVLTLSNTSTIDEVTLTTIKGETILTKKINALRSEIDLSNLSGGVYFLKVISDGTEKTMKIIKE